MDDLHNAKYLYNDTFSSDYKYITMDDYTPLKASDQLEEICIEMKPALKSGKILYIEPEVIFG